MNELTRRRFLARSAVVPAAALALPAVHVRGAESTDASVLRWGIIGTGTRGNGTHIPAINEAESCDLVALCDVAEGRLAAATKRAGNPVATYDDYQKLLANPDINAVVIASPNLFHREQFLAALQAGKHVLCEKPAGISVADAADMRRAAEGAKRVVMFGMQYRHVPKARKVRELIDAGKIGKPRMIVQNCSRGDWNLSPDVWQYADPKLANGQPRNWRMSHAATGGTLNEFSCHYLDLLAWYAGAPAPATVSADGGIAVHTDGRDTWDHASVTLAYDTGVKAVHTLSMFGPARGDVTVIGEEGTIEMLGNDTFRLVSAPRRKGERRATGATEEDIEVERTARKARGAADLPVLALFADFVECVKANKKPDADLARAVAASRTCWLAELSAERRAEVKWDDATAASA